MEKNLKIFVVEDDTFYAKLLVHHLSKNPDYEVLSFLSAKECLKNIHLKPDVITLDYSLPDLDGKTLIKKINDEIPNIPIIIISGQEDIKTALELLRIGAYDYIVKDENTKDLLWNSLIRVRENVSLRNQISTLKEEIINKYDFSKLIKGRSPAIQKIFSLMEKAASTKITTSITGETGTGKELVAKSIHYNSDRKKHPFVAVNVSAIPNELIESELFGHEKGSFTGANERRIGKFELAQKGTLFLDEIGEMDLNMQSKLLRVLQERELTRVGGNQNIKLDVRIIVATHKNLSDEVTTGNFREDLYYRILGLPIKLPALRERENDVVLLADFFINEFCVENDMNKVKLSENAKKKLLNYSWPGNIRELKAVVELAAILCQNNEIQYEDITFNSSNKISDLLNEEKTLKFYTQKIVKHYLEKYNDNVLKVADVLDIGKSTIYRMLKSSDF